jgi:hypothetical protein
MSAWTTKRRDLVRRLALGGEHTGEEIAEAMDSSRGSIMRELKRMGISLNGGKHGFRSKKRVGARSWWS